MASTDSSALRSRRSIRADLVFLPAYLSPEQVAGRVVVVFDVLRATTSMTAALSAGVPEIRIFGDIVTAAEAAARFPGPRLLCGEVHALPPPGFDLGNSPGAFNTAEHRGRTMFLSTTNGTKALIAAQGADAVLAGALVNATAVAEQLSKLEKDVILLCSGTDGAISMEDTLGAGAVLDALCAQNAGQPASDAARVALRLFRASRGNLRDVLAETTGGGNIKRVHLEADIDACARLDSMPLVGVLRESPLRVTL